MQWFKENWAAMAPFIQFVEVRDNNGRLLEWAQQVAKYPIIG
jgi:hypothetical protein